MGLVFRFHFIRQFLNRLKKARKAMEGLVASRREKLASVPSGGGAVAYSAPAIGGGGGAAASAATEQKKEEKVEEKGESYDNMGFSLFD
ncbi:hypothetical protein DVH24_026003 [Malus domestica]|uniref:Uncharacterized protein n=1 Tax=Malus domestica TaxID=3750 RepID=A0A498KHG6_MALDO|nr:hypothetical protein DVH24_026003 [Malus domestica]